MAITSAISDLFKSIYEVFASFFSAIYAVIHAAVSTVWNFILGVVNLVQSILVQAVHFTGGVGKFVASNFVALLVGGVLVFAYLRFSATGTRSTTVTQKKTQ
ncbi:hypothetical protein VFPPC_01292 [Pochonia chlamydosporia 170]|uniref:Uncharacterized protein n=1 Tax=Pochonia chlamydosporia 170 TaxID=1380566 RepID=A0A179G743_METCM|nr:hypothetical protein VFPPC_01292 [Pochonia chlamydosporia 170]OAQ73615.1 hypothetical protein VFPPC_01292 [Pochonia chlamydosporia 170]